MVFYFTGTGNSLYVAKQIETNPISIPKIMNQQEREFTADTIGIVAPVYGHEVPAMVRDFMKQSMFHTSYFYMILTYGRRHGGAAELAKKLCDECGIQVNYINVILMVDNWLPNFDMDEEKKLEKRVDENMAAILADLRMRKEMIAEVTDEDRDVHQQFLIRQSQREADEWKHLIGVTDTCIGCKICESVCPANAIHVIEKRAVHTPEKCQTCLACAHACPQKAIRMTISEVNPNARYRNEHITLQEIIDANNNSLAK